MPIHHRIPGIIGQAISRYGNRLLYSDKLVLGKAWTGFKHKSSIVTGIRHGLAAGGVVGGFINFNDDDELDGKIPQQYGSQAYKPDKTRGGRRGRNYGRNLKYCRPNRYRRRSSYR